VIRRVIATTAVFFLLFCAVVAACLRWGRGYPLSPPPATSRWLLLNDGLIAYEHNYGPTGPLHWFGVSAWVFHSGVRTDVRNGNRVGYWFVDLPIAALVLYPLMLILVVSRFHRGRHQRRPGHCPTCGYDLRASQHRCPECGTAIKTNSPG
jgi:predicted RNA-binding Zn-ribbon protein involved in translation (DUF1610 family)